MYKPNEGGANRSRDENMERSRIDAVIPWVSLVCVEPKKLIFDGQSSGSLTQVLKICNPYEYRIKFTVTCNETVWYDVIEPEGYISPKHVAHILIRVHSHLLANCNTVQTHKFRVKIYHFKDEKRVLGRRDIESVICFDKLPLKLDPTNESVSEGLIEALQSCPSGRDRNSSSGRSRPFSTKEAPATTSYSLGDIAAVICFILAVLSLLVIFVFPLDNEDCHCSEDKDNMTSSPSQVSLISYYLSMSLNLDQKLFAAFFLGLVCRHFYSAI